MLSSVMQLWLPIILSAIAVFIASSIVHMVIKWHNSDYHKLPNEEEVRACLKSSSSAPGMYFVPHMADMKEMAKPENVQKFVGDSKYVGILGSGTAVVLDVKGPKPRKMRIPVTGTAAR